jgi:hypothetical protein
MTAHTPDGHTPESDQMALAVRVMAHHAGQSSRVDRTGWTEAQWIEDADRLMGDLDGSIMSLVNGHVMALLAFWQTHRECSHAERCCRVHGTHSMPHKGCILR